MNRINISGKIVSDVEYKFCVEEKSLRKDRQAICVFKLQNTEATVIEVRGFNTMADNMYKTLKTGMTVIISGAVTDMGDGQFSIEALEFQKFADKACKIKGSRDV